MGTRMTQHSGRIMHAKAKHLDRDGIEAEHIDQDRTAQNRYWNCYDGEYSGRTEKEHYSLTEVEQKFYQEVFSGHIADVNARAERSYHPERRTSAEKMLKNRLTMPQEDIFQIGSTRDKSVNVTDLWRIWREYMQWHNNTYTQIKILDCALHADEAYPHIHNRQCYIAYENGVAKQAQEKCLEQMGVPLPDPSAPRSRTNNRKMTYTKDCREKLMEICAEHGYEIIDKPLENRRHNLPKIEAIVQELRNDRDTLLKEKNALMDENRRLKQRIKYMDAFNEFVADAEEEVERARARSKGR